MGAYDGGVTPERMFQRQSQKDHVLQELIAALELTVGDEVLDIGSGPGYASLIAARRVGPTGRVWALDEWAPAIAFLRARAGDIDWLRPLEADAAEFALPSDGVRRFLLTDVLHDAHDPEAIVRHLGRVLPSGARGVVSDYVPVAEKRFGPAPGKRIAPHRVQGWLEQEGFLVLRNWNPPDEHYAFLVEVKEQR